jgi:hypothetical protein
LPVKVWTNSGYYHLSDRVTRAGGSTCANSVEHATRPQDDGGVASSLAPLHGLWRRTPVSVDCAFPVDVAVARVSDGLEAFRERWRRMSRGERFLAPVNQAEMYGFCTPGLLQLSVVLKGHRRSMVPQREVAATLVGQIVPVGGRSCLMGTIGCSTYLRVCMTIWLGFALCWEAVVVISTIASGGSQIGTSIVLMAGGLVMMLVGLAAVAGFVYRQQRGAKYILTWLDEQLSQVGPPPDPVPHRGTT